MILLRMADFVVIVFDVRGLVVQERGREAEEGHSPDLRLHRSYPG